MELRGYCEMCRSRKEFVAFLGDGSNPECFPCAFCVVGRQNGCVRKLETLGLRDALNARKDKNKVTNVKIL